MNVPEPTPTLYVLISVSDPDGSDFFDDPNPDFKNPGMDPYLLRKKKIRSGFRPKDPDPERWF